MSIHALHPAAPEYSTTVRGLVETTRWLEVYLDVETAGPSGLTDYPGSLWHGLLGLGLRQAQCLRQPPCGASRDSDRCACLYGRLFEPVGRPATGFYAQATVPAPYVLRCRVLPGVRGERHRVGIGLWGEAAGEARGVVDALTAALRGGLGPNRATGDVMGVAFGPPGFPAAVAGNPVQVASVLEGAVRAGTHGGASGRVEVELPTPVRMKKNGHPARDLTYRDLLVAVLRRVSLMTFHHGEGIAGCAEWLPPREILGEAAAVSIVASSLRWVDGERFSARQGRSMPLGGLTGAVKFTGVPATHHPWLRLGAMLGLGHGATLGLGEMRWKELPDLGDCGGSRTRGGCGK